MKPMAWALSLFAILLGSVYAFDFLDFTGTNGLAETALLMLGGGTAVMWNLRRESLVARRYDPSTGEDEEVSSMAFVSTSPSSVVAAGHPNSTATEFELSSPPASVVPHIVHTFFETNASGIAAQFPGSPAMTELTRITSFSNGTLISTEEFVAFRVPDVPEVIKNFSAAAASNIPKVTLGNNIPKPGLPLPNDVSSWYVTELFVNAYEDSRLKPFVEAARRKVNILLSICNTFLGFLLWFVPTSKIKLMCIVVALRLASVANRRQLRRKARSYIARSAPHIAPVAVKHPHLVHDGELSVIDVSNTTTNEEQDDAEAATVTANEQPAEDDADSDVTITSKTVSNDVSSSDSKKPTPTDFLDKSLQIGQKAGKSLPTETFRYNSTDLIQKLYREKSRERSSKATSEDAATGGSHGQHEPEDEFDEVELEEVRVASLREACAVVEPENTINESRQNPALPPSSDLTAFHNNADALSGGDGPLNPSVGGSEQSPPLPPSSNLFGSNDADNSLCGGDKPLKPSVPYDEDSDSDSGPDDKPGKGKGRVQRGVHFADNFNGSPVSNTIRFDEQAAPAQIQQGQKMDVDAEGQQATGAPAPSLVEIAPQPPVFQAIGNGPAEPVLNASYLEDEDDQMEDVEQPSSVTAAPTWIQDQVDTRVVIESWDANQHHVAQQQVYDFAQPSWTIFPQNAGQQQMDGLESTNAAVLTGGEAPAPPARPPKQPNYSQVYEKLGEPLFAQIKVPDTIPDFIRRPPMTDLDAEILELAGDASDSDSEPDTVARYVPSATARIAAHQHEGWECRVDTQYGTANPISEEAEDRHADKQGWNGEQRDSATDNSYYRKKFTGSVGSKPGERKLAKPKTRRANPANSAPGLSTNPFQMFGASADNPVDPNSFVISDDLKAALTANHYQNLLAGQQQPATAEEDDVSDLGEDERRELPNLSGLVGSPRQDSPEDQEYWALEDLDFLEEQLAEDPCDNECRREVERLRKLRTQRGQQAVDPKQIQHSYVDNQQPEERNECASDDQGMDIDPPGKETQKGGNSGVALEAHQQPGTGETLKSGVTSVKEHDGEPEEDVSEDEYYEHDDLDDEDEDEEIEYDNDPAYPYPHLGDPWKADYGEDECSDDGYESSDIEHGGEDEEEDEDEDDDEEEDYEDEEEEEEYEDEDDNISLAADEDFSAEEQDGLPCIRRVWHALNRLNRHVQPPSKIEPPRRRFVNRQRTFDHESVSRNAWWCDSVVGRKWLEANWASFRQSGPKAEHPWFLIHYCNLKADAAKEKARQK